MARADGHISVMTFADPSRAAAMRSLRKQLRDMATKNGVRLIGSPAFTLNEIMGLWSGDAKQNYKVS